MTKLESIGKEISTEISKPEIQKALLATTFKGLDVLKMKQALYEGMMRGFEFTDFLEKNVYAIPYGSGYNLVTSVDYARKMGMRNGVVGKSAPVYEEKEGKIVSCSVTVKRKIGDHIGDYTATVYFDEYSTGRNLWATKPRTMIAKVAEMHALRMACPEELAKAYVEEEMHKAETVKTLPESNVSEWQTKLEAVESLTEMKKVWSAMPIEAKNSLKDIKEDLKKKFADLTPAK